MSQPAPSRLDALTSLRFFAAMMIVLFHTEHAFGRNPGAFNLAQGVSFFYVLSGFILTLVYPRLEGRGAVRRFWRARFARVWPAYATAFVVGAFLVDYDWRTPTAVAYLAMVQAWVPMPGYYFGYNAVGWSVSTEWFFYLVFPLLVANLERTWRWKLAATFALVLAMAALGPALGWPETGRAFVPEEAFRPDQAGLVYVHPLARLFEFTLGMCLALAWRRRGDAIAATTWAGTALEIGAIALCVGAVRASAPMTEWAYVHLGSALGRWVHASGSVLAFAALVYVMARRGGHLSRALAWRPLVVAGEISFSIYLLHQLLLNGYLARLDDLPKVPDGLAFALYLGLLWLASYVTWRVVEMPARRLIVGAPLHGSSVVTQSRAARLVPAFALATLVACALALNAATAKPATVAIGPLPPAQLQTRHSPRSCNFEFAGLLRFQPRSGAALPVTAGTVRIAGWFLSEFTGVPGGAASLRIRTDGADTGWVGPIVNWSARPDVLASMQATGEGPVGFAQRFDLGDLPPGTYRLGVLFEHAGKTYACEPGRRIVIAG